MTNISSKVSGGDWQLPNLKQNPGQPANPAPQGGGETQTAKPYLPSIDLGPKIGIKPTHPVEPCIGLKFHVDVVQEVEQIRHAKGSSQIQGLMEFKQILKEASGPELEKAQNYLVDQMAEPDNRDDQLLGALLKAVNNEINSPKLKPFPPDFEPIKPFPIGKDDDWRKPVAD